MAKLSALKIAQRIEELTRRINPSVVAIEVPHGMDEGAVVDRHMAMHPEDAGAELTVVLTRFAEPEPGRDGGKIGAAWRSVAKDMAAETALSFWLPSDDAKPN